MARGEVDSTSARGKNPNEADAADRTDRSDSENRLGADGAWHCAWVRLPAHLSFPLMVGISLLQKILQRFIVPKACLYLPSSIVFRIYGHFSQVILVTPPAHRRCERSQRSSWPPRVIHAAPCGPAVRSLNPCQFTRPRAQSGGGFSCFFGLVVLCCL